MPWFLILVVVLGQNLVSAGTNSDYDYYRLPRALRPQKYHLNVLTHLDNPENLKFEGTVKITIAVLENTKNITLHSKNLTIDDSQVTLRQITGDNKDNCVSSISVNTNYDFYILKTCQELVAGSTYELSLPFSAALNTDVEGYFLGSYKNSGSNETRWYSSTFFEPVAARSAFPCFDEPAFKARFVITLGYNNRFRGISNMPVKQTRPHETLEDYIWCEFQESVAMSTYLVAYSVNDFSFEASTIAQGPVFRTWARPNAVDQCHFAAEFGPKILKYYEDFLGIEFPLPKIDMLAVPDFEFGGMENWGMVMYEESTLLYSEAYSSLTDKQQVASTIAHELAHQWFGNLVTMKWWTDLWLNEGFATYVTSLGVDHIYPEWRSRNQNNLINLMVVADRDSLENSHPVSRPTTLLSEIKDSFDEMAYEKGASLIRMMHLFLGEMAFRSGLKSYLQEYEYGNAEQDNLWQSLTIAAHKTDTLPRSYDLKTIMDSWTLQAGFPLINVTRNYAAKTATLSQERFLLNPTSLDAKRKGCWWVPLSYTSQTEKDFSNMSANEWLECGQSGNNPTKTIQNIAEPDQWVIFNIQFSTLCTVNYDVQNWKLLTETLTKGDYQSIHALNRAQLINDALHLAWTGAQDYKTALELVNYLQREREYLPWLSANVNLIRMDFLLRGTPHFGSFKRFVRKLVTPLYEHFQGTNDTFTSIQEPDQILLKTMAVTMACRHEMPECIDQSLNYIHKWRSVSKPDLVNPVPPDLRAIVYCTAIGHGTNADWEFLWQRYLNCNVASEQDTILTTFGCSKDKLLLQALLDRAFDPKGIIPKKDSTRIFISVAASTVGFHLAKKYFMDHVQSIYQFYSPMGEIIVHLAQALSKFIVTRSDYNEFKEFVSNSGDMFRDLNLTSVETNVLWLERNIHQISQSIEQLL
ncbi:hypothetical protein KR018_003846 [Drosophila ironensis]|nr:hypothetical protein KR018_003846 [Drosophila ironensis]